MIQLSAEDMAQRKVVVSYMPDNKISGAENLTVVPRGLLFDVMPGDTTAKREWVLYVYDLDHKKERVLRMNQVLSWRAVPSGSTPP